ncbi:dipeptidase PepE [Aliivibrio sp. S4TY2]|uniref:dipeptidase PepE n=1 Tax=unclassified Aliivibrio TaxID=2645654 RepID=UPI00237860FD|nr:MULTISPECIES: dipeptidase PepE [unclassified Aliivibrio]MDD9155141.1 dipeptidase PepE [Aliivibrio sp. S4TY2]MDD9159307.1 dipeptidase PepE [Aliivibrio sp. S4TY1]MDD9163143.1 dipeptidase PepE [Aliivibrio sp. S4MY2]MDD9167306.1 dipeptidase PepE [Aliivibrio sp. S4MY4]MDD9184220.1 dipeptidase PepE [Aliivibrio sp. S4MY3]
MDILLLSNGKIAGNNFLMEFASEAIVEQIQRTKAKNLVLIPYAVIRSSHDDRVALVQQTFDHLGLDCKVTGLHRSEDPVKTIQEADGILVSGGNTWVLNKTLHDLGLVGPIRKAVLDNGVPYIGWSAGTNIGCPTIRTTNDMPIVTGAILPSLNLVPFQINPHYLEASVEGHFGETRDERIQEFLEVNKHEPVVGIPEGTWLHVLDGKLSYYTANEKPLKLFSHGKDPVYYTAEDDVQFLMEHSC